MANRVVITGMGAITPLGNNVETFWEGLKKGKAATGPITKYDTSNSKIKLACEVKVFNPQDYMDFKTMKRMEPFAHFAVAAAKEAIEQSGINMENEDPYRVGVIVSSGIGSLQAHEREQVRYEKSGKIAPMYIPMMIANMASANIAIMYGMKGINTCVVTACATGAHSIGDAFKAIKYGDADIMVTGGCEASVCKTGVQGFAALTALSTNEDPETASRPFDKNRDGFVIGEGSGVLVLENYDHAVARGANILAELVGYGATCDAYHITSPAEDGSGAGEAMIIAMKEAGIKPSDIDYINAHGTSTHHNDLFETRAMKYAFKEDIKNISINSTKSMIGHVLGGAGGVELITCVKAIQDGFVHVTAGSKESEGEMDLDYTFFEPKNRDITYAMTNNLGFGGHNASLIVKKFV